MQYRTQLPPYDHQKKALKDLAGKKYFALLMAMRTGKTKVIIDDFGRLVVQGGVEDLLIIAPAGVYTTWEAEVKRHLGLDVLRRTWVHTWSAQHNGRVASAQLQSFVEHRAGPRVLLVNIEALSSVKRARELIEEFVAQRRCMVAVDESTTIKNYSAKRTKYLIKTIAPLAEYRRILSGLPTPRSPLDVFGQYQFLSRDILDFKSYMAFQFRYGVIKMMPIGGRKIPIVVGYRNLKELGAKVEPHSFRIRLEDCYDLPPKIYQKREVQLTDEQERIYAEMAKVSMSLLSGTDYVTATEVIVQILRLHQIVCGHTVDEQGKFHTIPEKRTDELLKLLDEYDGSGKVIVWCTYDWNVQDVTDRLRDVYGDDSVARFWGGNKPTRDAEEAEFKTNKKCRFMVATPAAGGRGREWSSADLVVYFSSTPDLEHRFQSEERAQAIGKTRSVLYVDLVAPGTVDEKIIRALRQKIDLSAIITGDNYTEWLI